MPQNQPSIPTYGFLRLPQILKIIPIGKSSWWEGCRTGRYRAGCCKEIKSAKVHILE